MSHSFYIQDVADASLSQTLEALPFDDLIVDTPDANGGWPELAHIYQDNVSVRSIETGMTNGTLQVRIMANSAPEDFQLAAAILDFVASRLGKDIEPEDNDTMPLERWREEYGETWQREQARTYLQMMVSMYQNEKYTGNMTMFGTRRQFEVGPRLMEPLLQDPQNFSETFFDRFRRLNYLDREDVFGPSMLGAKQEGSDKQAVFSVLGDDVPTALSSEAAFVVLNHSGLQSEGEDGQTVLKFDDFVEIAGDTLTWLGDGVALTPAYTGAEWQALVAAAQAKSTGLFDHPELLRDADEDDSAAASSDGEEAGAPYGIPAEHWEILGHSVVAVFLIIAGADGTIDKKEVVAFQKKLVEGVVGLGDSEIMPVAMLRATTALEERVADLGQREPTEIAQIVAASRQIVAQHAGEERAAAFAQALYDLGESIAKASGGGFLGLGSKIGKEEKAVLNGIQQLLQLD